jgi:DNA-binding GntR family transcriptional regulator
VNTITSASGMPDDTAPAASDRMVDRAYLELKEMVLAYALKPGERLNEVELARRIGVSRTPLREALNRLKTESLLRFAPGKGYFGRDLDVHETFQLYELRKAIEIAAVRLAVQRARDEEIDALEAFLHRTGPDAGELTVQQQVEYDEAFHISLLSMCGNAEMLKVLSNINERIRFVRHIDMGKTNRVQTQSEHMEAVAALRARDETACVAVLEKHIDRRLDQITAALKQGYVRIYMPHAA